MMQKIPESIMSMKREIENEPKRFKNTISLYFLFMCHGLVLGIMGPSILDLQIACESEISSVIHITTGRAAGLAFGSFIPALIYTHLDVLSFLGIGTLISASIVLAIPFVRSVYLLIVIFFSLGCNMGAFESAATVFLIDLWGTENKPFMTLLHVFFALGAFISPLLAAAFLSNYPHPLNIKSAVTSPAPASFSSVSSSSFIENITFILDNGTQSTNDEASFNLAIDSMLLFPYLLIATCMACTAVTLLVMRLLYQEREPHRTRMQHLTLCPTHGIGELFTDKLNPIEVKLSKIIHPDVSRIVNAESHVEKVSHVTQTSSPTCGKCNRVRRFTFSNNGNALSIVSNSTYKKPRVNTLVESTNCTSSPFASPFASPLSSPFTSPQPDRRVRDEFTRSSVTSDCSVCLPKLDKSHPLPVDNVSDKSFNLNTSDINEHKNKKKINLKRLSTFFDDDEVQKEYKTLVIVLSALFLHFYCGLAASFGSLVSPFAIKSPLAMGIRTASLVSSVYWGAFALSRVLMFFYVSLIDSKSWIVLNVLLCLLSNVFLVPFGSQYQWALWIGSMIMGIGLNAIWMCTIGYIEQFMPVTPKIMITFTISAYIGQMLVPSIVSPFIETYPTILMWISFAYSLAMLLFLTAIIYLCSYKLNKTQSPTESL